MHFKKFAAKTSTEHSRCERLREKVGVKIFFDNTFIFSPSQIFKNTFMKIAHVFKLLCI